MSSVSTWEGLGKPMTLFAVVVVDSILLGLNFAENMPDVSEFGLDSADAFKLGFFGTLMAGSALGAYLMFDAQKRAFRTADARVADAV